MNPRLLALGLLLATWVVVASWILVWVWPLAVALSFAAGWLLSNAAAKQRSGAAYLSVFVLPLATAVALFVWFPMQDFGRLLGQFAFVHVAVALGAFTFIRHVVRTQSSQETPSE